MQAPEEIKDCQDGSVCDDDYTARRLNIFEELKPEINNFLWVNLPNHITIKEADKLARKIYQLIYDEWEKDPSS